MYFMLQFDTIHEYKLKSLWEVKVNKPLRNGLQKVGENLIFENISVSFKLKISCFNITIKKRLINYLLFSSIGLYNVKLQIYYIELRLENNEPENRQKIKFD